MTRPVEQWTPSITHNESVTYVQVSEAMAAELVA
jgi:hypothetical protein